MSRFVMDGEEPVAQDASAAEPPAEVQADAPTPEVAAVTPADDSAEAEVAYIRKQQRQDRIRQETEDYAAEQAAAEQAVVEQAATEQAVVEQAAAAQPAAERTYTVQPGDSLSAIALEVYGDAGRWPDILAANSDTVANANLIFPGQVLRIP